jgi:hypothetical protein
MTYFTQAFYLLGKIFGLFDTITLKSDVLLQITATINHQNRLVSTPLAPLCLPAAPRLAKSKPN